MFLFYFIYSLAIFYKLLDFSFFLVVLFSLYCFLYIFHLILYVVLCLCFKYIFISSSCHFIFSLLTFYFRLISWMFVSSRLSFLNSLLHCFTLFFIVIPWHSLLSSFLISWHLFPYQLVFSLHFPSLQSPSQKYESSSGSHSSGFSFHRQTQLQTDVTSSDMWLILYLLFVCVSYRHFYFSDRPILTHPACGDHSFANSSLSLTLKPKSCTCKYPRTNTSFTLKLECNLALHIGYI